MTRKLTETAVSRAGVPATGQTMLWDAQVTGFAVRILPGGSRTFWFQYRTAGGRSGKNRMVRIGAWPTISLNVARKRARDLAGQVARGEDPAATRAEAKRRDSSTLRALCSRTIPGACGCTCAVRPPLRACRRPRERRWRRRSLGG